MRCKTSCGKTRPHTTTLASICAYCATNHCQCPAYGNMEHDQRICGRGKGEGLCRLGGLPMESLLSRRALLRWTVQLSSIMILSLALLSPDFANAQSLQIVNMAVPARSFQMVIYPIAQVKGYMKEEGLDERVIFVAPTTSIQAMLGGDVQFTGAGSSALVSMARGNTPLKVIVATNDRVLQWLVTRPEITSLKDLKGKKIATTGVAAVATFMARQVLIKHGLDGNKDVTYFDLGQRNQLASLLGRGVHAAV